MKMGRMSEMEVRWMMEVIVEEAAGLTMLMDWDLNIRLP